jgi:hypothetical protein
MTWINEGYVVVKNVLNKDVRRVLSHQFKMFRDNMLLQNPDKFAFNDHQVEKSFVYYSFYGFEALLETVIKDEVEKQTGIKVYPSYSFARIYYNDAEMKIHKDRKSCQISATCCIDTDGTDWPIGFVNRAGERIYISQEPGDVIIYSGCELQHWRDKYTGQEQVQAFMHYVDVNGEYAYEKYDGRAMLGLPSVRR